MTWILIHVIAVYLLMNGVSSQITLSSMPPEGRGACPMDVRTFTCVTNGSATHAWQSDEYIGASASVSGEQLEFTYLDSPGDVLAGDSPARAELIRRVLEVNETVGLLESELRVTVSADYQNATISCLYVDTGNTISTSFQLLDIPEAPQNVMVVERPQNVQMQNSCILLIQFSPPRNLFVEDIDRYVVDYQSGNITIRDTSSTFIVGNCTKNLLVRVRAVNRCDKLGTSSLEMMPVFLPQDEGVSPGEPTDNTGIGTEGIVGIIVAIVVFVGIVIIVIIALYLCASKRPQSSKGDKQVSVYAGEQVHLDEVTVSLDDGKPVPVDPRNISQGSKHPLMLNQLQNKVTSLQDQIDKIRNDLKGYQRVGQHDDAY